MDERKALKRAYKEAPVQAGIWLIRNRQDGKVLLGSALNLPSRLNRIRFELSTGSHECKDLQADWKRLGAEAFSIEAAEALKKPDDNPFFDVPGALADMEAAWRSKLKPWGAQGYHQPPAGT